MAKRFFTCTEIEQGLFHLARDLVFLLHKAENSRLFAEHLVQQTHFLLFLGVTILFLDRLVGYHLDEALCSILIGNISEVIGF